MIIFSVKRNARLRISLLSLFGYATTTAGHEMAVIVRQKTSIVLDFAFRIGRQTDSTVFLVPESPQQWR